MAKPIETLDFATDANYPAGPNVWNGTPTKVAPSAGLIAAGYDPAVPLPAQHVNYILSVLWLWLVYLDSLVGHAIHSAIDFQGISATLVGDPAAPGAVPWPLSFKAHPAGKAWSSMKYAVPGMKISTIAWVVRGPVGGGSVTVILARAKSDGVGFDTIATATHACDITSIWETVTLAPNHEVAAGYAYWIAASLDDNTEIMMATVTPG